ncbi:hypothetical protein CPB83DRAFT_859253 [Crepidotus variabilis]|uniref:Protein-S-isoprenylcysteine O-methyltransferase n=1 Tax=Crepidotus variabilis TaxID=179855 RepID=A0A9P6EAQ0_9AGAR|nr:hypothetical protein CPB83DRAFT_859253 [Crepidotus variabilis]
MSLSATPPNGELPKEQHIIPDWRERFTRRCVEQKSDGCSQWMYWVAGAVEIIIIITSYYPATQVARFLGHHLHADQARIDRVGQVTYLFLVGNTMTFLGTILRLHSYRTLGKYFTFELALFRDHSLVVSGPYSIIRHPSYSGLVLSIIGAFINAFLADGSWTKESGIVLETTMGLVWAVIWTMIAVAVILSLLLRIPSEERLLRQRFGDDWEQWARKVRYRLVPGIY